MTREEAIRIMQLNKGRMNGSVQAALAVLLPELRKEPEHTIDGKEGLIFWLKERIAYYDEIIPGARKNNPRWYEFYKGRRSGYRTCLELLKRMENIHIVVEAGKLPMDEIEHQQEKMCATCAYYVQRTDWEGRCGRLARTGSLPPDDTCELWEPYDTSNVEKSQAAPKATPCCLNCGEKEKCSREDKRWGGPCEAHRMEGQKPAEQSEEDEARDKVYAYLAPPPQIPKKKEGKDNG